MTRATAVSARRAARRVAGTDPLRLYRLLAGYPWLATYSAKFVAVVAACVGIATLLVMLVIVFTAGRIHALGLLFVVLVVGVATVFALARAIVHLLRPLHLAARALDALSQNVDLPRMEITGTDDAAQILRGVQGVIGRLRDQEERTRSAGDFDELTGLYQRRAGRARGQALVESETRKGRRVRVIVADVDGMHAFNARLGAGQGDALLRMLAARLAHVAGERGIAARWSGDRFLIVQTLAAEAVPPLDELLGRPFVVKGSEEAIRLTWGDVITDAPVSIDQLICEAEDKLVPARLS